MLPQCPGQTYSDRCRLPQVRSSPALFIPTASTTRRDLPFSIYRMDSFLLCNYLTACILLGPSAYILYALFFWMVISTLLLVSYTCICPPACTQLSLLLPLCQLVDFFL